MTDNRSVIVWVFYTEERHIDRKIDKNILKNEASLTTHRVYNIILFIA